MYFKYPGRENILVEINISLQVIDVIAAQKTALLQWKGLL